MTTHSTVYRAAIIDLSKGNAFADKIRNAQKAVNKKPATTGAQAFIYRGKR
ncbi:hypothetical protein KQH60_13020 [Mycetohabitans sp. B8]|uniref:hypothetical protein n=1 Tax=Mycetohabitans sp. B8 TaxID=2841845 RepID=UPI001F1BEE2F|nr:hypothetical protein [Mycetohabitans sp. B8]MCG1043405.1 hypothetical protein [Mycetohabitans sp. B8]